MQNLEVECEGMYFENFWTYANHLVEEHGYSMRAAQLLIFKLLRLPG